ncbi:hypothetical protein Cgig2_017960 [Carnegiea gigantea]|uniref:Pentatricopeptide repeat-containing protein n=1 Tax=Carnegiea gigantea TaxID=171969 RepID=A0A9Q1K8H1_9CARY|nr:hypothetical protein Cgig2_017960 [Carnegiea gigantea]
MLTIRTIIKARNSISVSNSISDQFSQLFSTSSTLSPTLSKPAAAPTTAYHDDLVNEAGRARDFRRVRHLLIKRINEGCFSSKDTFRFITNTESLLALLHDLFECIASVPKGVPRRSALDAFINRLCKLGFVKDALQVLDKMRQRKLEINAYSYHPVLNALTSKKDVEGALRVLEGMKAIGINPDTTSYNYILTAYCVQGEAIEAGDLLEMMLGEKGVKADARTYDAMVLGACRAGKVEGALAMKFVMSFAGRERGADKENLELLGNGFLKLGRFEDAKRVAGEMFKRALPMGQKLRNF